MRSLARFDEMRLSGLLPASGALLYVVHAWLDTGHALDTVIAVTAVLALAGFVLPSRAMLGRALASAALVVFVVDTASILSTNPGAALAVWLFVSWLLLSMWLLPGLPNLRRLAPRDIEHPARLARVRIGLRMTSLVAVSVAISRTGTSTDARAVVVGALLVTGIFAWQARPLPLLRQRRVIGLLLLLVLFAAVLWEIETVGEFPLVLLGLLAVITGIFVRDVDPSGVVQPTWWERFLDHPARQLVASFLLLILVGTLLLGLPVASATDQPASLVDSAFTAVSAVCVTGLVVIDTATAWSHTGQVILLVLIQLGGLGIMTFATAFLGALGRRLSLRQEGVVAEVASNENRQELFAAVRTVLFFTLSCEAVGAGLLTLLFVQAGESWPVAAWHGVFTAISAFCNAGFALQSDSLVGHATHAGLLHVVALLIVLGGLSPALVARTMRRRRGAHLQTRLVLTTTAALLGIGTVLFLAAEWANTLAGMSVLDKLHNAWFQSVTLRTAGFNSVDIAALRPATTTIAMVWMFIGGSPGGTAGGIKTTTFAVLILAVIATVRGRRVASAFGRAIPHGTVYRAASIATMGLFSVVVVLLAVQLTQDIPTVPALFEVVSALGTVGLSMGATATLDAVGKIVVMVAMFAGRVGSLTMLVFLMARRGGEVGQLPQATVDVG